MHRPELPSPEKRLAEDRIRNASRAAVEHDPELAQVGTMGAVAYALLEVANAIREHSLDPKSERLLSISDHLIDEILEGKSEGRDERLKKLAEAFQIERKGFDIDQHAGLDYLDGMR